MPEHDANLIVFRSVIEQIGQCDVHGRLHCVFPLWPIQLDPQDVSRTLSNNVTHNIYLLCCHCRRGWARDDAASAQALDFLSVEPELLENFVVMFAEIRGSLGRNLGHAMHLNRTTDRKLQVFSGALEWDDYVVSL